MVVEKKAAARKKTSAEEAAEAAERIRADIDGRRSVAPGDILNGDPEHWHYVHAPAEDKNNTLRLEAKLAGRGYAPCTGDETMIGMNTGRLWRLPKIIYRELMADRHRRIQARAKQGAGSSARIR